jgi:hypothetical protein
MRRFFLAPLVLAFALAVSVRAADPADTTPPTLVSATRYTTNMYQIHVTFSERMDTNSVFQETNYRIRTLSGTPVRTLLAVLVETNNSVTPRSTTNVVVTVAEELDLTRDWGLYVARVSDTNDNVMVGTNSVVIRTVSTLIPREGEWYRRDDAYYPEFAQFRFTDNSWAQVDYDYESQFLFGLARLLSRCWWHSAAERQHHSVLLSERSRHGLDHCLLPNQVQCHRQLVQQYLCGEVFHR